MSVELAPDLPQSTSNRLVWVVSNLEVPSNLDKYEGRITEKDFWYVEKFRSDTIRIPPGGKKRLLMHFLAAKRFLGRAVPPQSPFANGGFINDDEMTVHPERFGKPLEIVELTDEERQEFEGLSPIQAMNRVKDEEEELSSKKHTREGQDTIAVGTGKPQAHRILKRPPDVTLDDIQRIDQ